VQISFSGIKTIDRRITLRTITPTRRAETRMTFSLCGITAFSVQGWNGSSCTWAASAATT
jgi:hypothetical protein